MYCEGHLMTFMRKIVVFHLLKRKQVSFFGYFVHLLSLKCSSWSTFGALNSIFACNSRLRHLRSKDLFIIFMEANSDWGKLPSAGYISVFSFIDDGLHSLDFMFLSILCNFDKSSRHRNVIQKLSA